MRCPLLKHDIRELLRMSPNETSRVGGKMGRSKLRGIEMAGVTLAIEVPSNLAWQWPDERTRSLACAPVDPDVHIGVRVARPRRPLGDTFRYESRGLRFEIGWEGENWVVAIYGADGCQRTARFDADFRYGEIVVLPEYAATDPYPLAHPLDELIMLHRLMREGCLIVNGTVSIQDRQARLFIDAGNAGMGSNAIQSAFMGAAPDSRCCGQVVLRPVLERDAISDTRVWVHQASWRIDCPDPGMGRVPLEAIHILASAEDARGESLTQDAAANDILQHVFAPFHDPDAAERLFEIIERVVRRTKIFRMRKPSMKREVSFNWDGAQAAAGFAPPSL